MKLGEMKKNDNDIFGSDIHDGTLTYHTQIGLTNPPTCNYPFHTKF